MRAAIICLLCFITSVSLGQELTEVNQKVDNNLIAKYQILKNNPNIKQGSYMLYTRKKSLPIVTGWYKDNKRIGAWRFFDNTGRLVQLYDFTNSELKYELPDDDMTGIQYVFDANFQKTDLLTKPVKIGGRYYGYLPYVNLFIAPEWFKGADAKRVTIELLVSPGGRLAEFKFHLSAKVFDGFGFNTTEDILQVNLNVLSEDDKMFIPATMNKEPVASRIVVKTWISGNDKLSLFPQ